MADYQTRNKVAAANWLTAEQQFDIARRPCLSELLGARRGLVYAPVKYMTADELDECERLAAVQDLAGVRALFDAVRRRYPTGVAA
jgi:hypothetical protein